MKKTTLLATSVALVLTGCNSSSDGDTPPPPATNFTITAIDGYLQNAFVFGTDSNVSYSSCNVHIGNTDDNGQFVVPAKYRAEEVCIEAREYTTIDSNRGVVTERFSLRAPSQSAVINPMTNLVSALADNPDMSVEEAQKRVVEQITTELDVAPELIFGDYIADKSDEAEALNIIGEVLVDHSSLTVDEQLEIVAQVAELTQEVIDNGDNISDFNPVVDIDDGINVSRNQRPQVVEQLAPLKLDVGNHLKPIYLSAYFNDPDGDKLTYSMEEVFSNADESIRLNEELGIISGSVSKAGNFIYHIFATDDKGSRSYPLVLSISVETEVQPPAVNDAEQHAIQSDINDWELIEGSQIEYKVDVTGLFNSEQDLRFEAKSSLEWDIAAQETDFHAQVEGHSVVFFGPIPRSAVAGFESLIIEAFDNVHSDPTVVEFKLPEIEKYLPQVNVDPEVFEQLKGEISDWVIYEGQELTYTLDANHLFHSNDEFVLKADSSLSEENTGFDTEATNGIVSFSGNVPHSAAAGQETLTVSAVNESYGISLSEVEFKLPEIHEGATPPENHPLENTTWHFLDYGEYDREDNYIGAQRVFCESIRFENGAVYINSRTVDNLYDCSEATELHENADYSVKGDIVELRWKEEDALLPYVMDLTINKKLDAVTPGAVEVRQRFKGLFGETYLHTFFASSPEPERRLNFKSNQSEIERAFNMYLPSEENFEYDLGIVAMDMNSHSKLNVQFSVEGKDFTCDTLQEYYYSFAFTGLSNSNEEIYHTTKACTNNVGNEFISAEVNFNPFQALKVGETYSVVGYVDEEKEAYMPDIMFSIEWEGESNND